VQDLDESERDMYRIPEPKSRQERIAEARELVERAERKETNSETT
jgi:hypothetical protein